MHRLGGSVITAADIGATSLAKGESIADMARVIGSYADIITIRHLTFITIDNILHSYLTIRVYDIYI